MAIAIFIISTCVSIVYEIKFREVRNKEEDIPTWALEY